jgi:hypothetical protein
MEKKLNVQNHDGNSIEPSVKTAKLAYTAREVCEILGISRVSLWRVESRSLLRSVGCFRRKCYPHSEVVRFLEEQTTPGWKRVNGNSSVKKSREAL